ncbi:MAG: ATP-binding protein [Bacillota bacterium]
MPGFWFRSLKFEIIFIVAVLLLIPLMIMIFDIKFLSRTDDVLVQELENKLTRISERMRDEIQSQVTNELKENPELDVSFALRTSFERRAEPIVDINKGVRLGLYIVEQDKIFTEGYLHKTRPPGGESPYDREKRIFNETVDGIKAVVAGGAPISKLGKTWDDRFLEYLVPIYVDTKLVAVVFAQERMHPVFAESAKARQVIQIFTIAIFIFGVGATLFSLISWVRSVGHIKDGLIKLESNLNNQLPDMPGEMGQITRAINKMAASLTEKEQMAEELRRSEYLSALGRFVTDIAHELRSPVSIIQTTVELMEPQARNQTEMRECLAMIQKQLDRHNHLTTELLNFGSPAQIKREVIDLRELVNSVTKPVKPLLQKNKIILKVAHSEELPLVKGDQEKLTQTFLNLIMNAVQAMPGGGTLSIKTFVKGDTLCVEIADTGKGIQQEDLKKIFNPFFTTKKGGSGLGLAISKKILESHGGTINVESLPEKGATFTICLPTNV